MRRLSSKAWFGIAAILAAGFFIFIWLNRGPSYRGHNASFWLHVGGPEQIEAFHAMGEEAVPMLLDELNYHESSLGGYYRTNFNRVPGWLRKNLPVPELEAQKQSRAIFLLRMMGWEARAAVPDLIPFYRIHYARLAATINTLKFNPVDMYLSESALAAISEIGGGDAQLVPTLLDAARDGARQSWQMTPRSSISWKTNLAPAVWLSLPLLMDALHDTNAEVRLESIRALGLATQDNREIVDRLLAHLAEPDADLRSSTAISLGNARDPAAISDIASSLTNNDSQVRAGAADALGRIGPPAKMAVPKLAELASTNEPDNQVRRNAAEAIWTIDHQAWAVLPYRIQALRADNDFERWTALSFFKECGAEAKLAVPQLIEVLARDKNDRVRAKAALVLGDVGPAAAEALPALRAASKDEYQSVRTAAAEAIRNISRGVGSQY